MREKTRARLAVGGGTAAALAGVIAFTAANAGAEPVLPMPPAPVTVTQTVTVAPAGGAPTGLPLANAGASVAPLAAPAVPVAPAGAVPAGQAAQAALPVAQPTLVPASSGSLTDYFKSKGVQLEPQRPQGFTAVSITLPMPLGWSQVPDPNVPDAFLVTADRNGGDGLYTPNAQVVVYKAIGDFDPKEAITHGFIDSQSEMAWQTTNASLADFYGLPSSLIEGTYRQNNMTLNTSRRHVIVPVGPTKYLVSLAVTTSLSQVVAEGSATDAIVNGFRVAPGMP
ncbi:MAG: LpqN/LpqT family lipoprotein [Mycobacteriaceae bacterium]|nr:LpqN/LpqT family lipoprotein [Mycobacteriaceae bacterium]